MMKKAPFTERHPALIGWVITGGIVVCILAVIAVATS